MDVKRYDFKPANFQAYRSLTNGAGNKAEIIGRDDFDYVRGGRYQYDSANRFNCNITKKVGGELVNQRHGNGTDEFGFANRFVISYDDKNQQPFSRRLNPYAYIISGEDIDGNDTRAYSFGNFESFGTAAFVDLTANTFTPYPDIWQTELHTLPIYGYWTTISGYGPNTSPYDWDKFAMYETVPDPDNDFFGQKLLI